MSKKSLEVADASVHGVHGRGDVHDDDDDVHELVRHRCVDDYVHDCDAHRHANVEHGAVL